MKRVSVLIAARGAGHGTAPAAAADLDSFTSPSGNIGCIIYEEYLRCDIAERDWLPPPRPADCPSFTGYGRASAWTRTDRQRSSAPGTPRSTADRLGYGQTHTSAGFVCTSEAAGLRCTNADGHGFQLAREAYDLF